MYLHCRCSPKARGEQDPIVLRMLLHIHCSRPHQHVYRLTPGQSIPAMDLTHRVPARYSAMIHPLGSPFGDDLCHLANEAAAEPTLCTIGIASNTQSLRQACHEPFVV